MFKPIFPSNYCWKPYSVIHGLKAVYPSFVLVLLIFTKISTVKFVQLKSNTQNQKKHEPKIWSLDLNNIFLTLYQHDSKSYGLPEKRYRTRNMALPFILIKYYKICHKYVINSLQFQMRIKLLNVHFSKHFLWMACQRFKPYRK